MELLARKNGEIAIIDIVKTTPSYIEFRYAMENKSHKIFKSDQDKTWKLVEDVGEAIHWIKEKNPKEAV